MVQKRATGYGSIAVPGKPLEKAGTTSIKIRFVPHEDILHYQNVRLVNGAVKFDDGSEMVFNNTNIHLKMDKDRSELPVDSLMYQDSWYTFKFEFKDSKFRANNLSHLKGDLVVDTTTKQNILLAHIDEDIVKK